MHKPVRWAVEGLERRLLLAAVSWTGGGDGLNWTDPHNWSTNALPGAADTVTINAAGNPTITIASGSQAVSTLTTSDPLTIASGAALAVGSTLGGAGTLTNSGTLTLKSTTVNTPLVNRGTVSVASQSNTIAGAFTASAGSMLSLDDNNNYAGLTVSSGFTNDGTITLSTEGAAGYTDTLTVTSGTLTNAADGTIATSGSGSDAQTITAALTNQGVFNVQHGLTVSNGSKTLTAASGTLSIAAGQTLKVTGGTVSLGSTVLSGSGTLDLTGDTVNLAGNQTLTATGVQMILTNATINGPGTLTNASGNTLTLSNTKVNAPLVNQGTVVATSTGSIIAGGFTASPGSTLSLSDNSNYAQVTFSGGFTNDGTIALSTTGTAGYTVTLTVSSGTLTNASDGTITASGTGSDSLSITAVLNNQGVLNLQHGLTLNAGTGASSNSGTIGVSGGDLTISQAAAGVFTDTGALTIAAGHSLNFSNGTLDLNAGGTVGGAGTLNLSNVTVNLGVNLSNGATALDMPNSTINGPGTLTDASGKALTLNNTKVNAPLVNQGTIIVTNTGNTIGGTFAASAGSLLSLDDNNNYAALTVSGGFTNDGTIAMSTESSAGYSVTLTMSPGATLTNAADGAIAASGSGADALILTGALTNQGVVNVQHNLTISNSAKTLDATAGTLSISAGKTLTVSGGTLTLGSTALSGAGTVDATADTINLAAGQTLTATGVQLILTSATVNGPGTLTSASGTTLTLNNTKVNAPMVNQGTVAVVNTGSIIGGTFTASPGSTLSLNDNNNYDGVTFSNGFTNDGTIALSTTGTLGYNVTLTVTSGTLTNAADGTITATGSGTDSLNVTAALTNQGLVNVLHSLTVNNSAKTLDATSGTLSIAPGQTLKAAGGTVSLGSTALSGAGTLDVTGDTLNLSGNQTLTATGVQMIATSATINGPGILTNGSGNTLTLNGTKVNAPLVNQGTVAVVNTANTITGGFTAPAGSTLKLNDNNNYVGLSVAGFTNDGTIALSTQGNGGYNVTLTISSGTLTNAADGTITASGTGADLLTISSGTIASQGMLTVQHGLTLSSGSLDTSSGTLSIAAGQTLSVNSETLTLGSTVLSGTGTLAGSSDTVNLASSQTLPAGVVQVTFANSTVNGPGTLTNAASLTLSNTKVNASLVNQGTLVATNTGDTITGGFTASPGSTLSLSDNTNYAQLTFSGGFTNDGTIALSTQSNGGYNVTLTMSSGATLTNAADGTITASGTGIDALTVNGALSNQGTLSVQTVKLTVQNPTNLSSNVLTNGTWQVSGGGKLILPSTITTNAAHIALDGPAAIITNSGGTTNALGGLVTNAAGAGLTLTGGQALAVTPAGGTFTNYGTLTLGTGSELNATGAFSQNLGALLSIQIGGATGANFGQVVAGGTATAGGNLQASFVNAYDPPATQTFAVLNGASETGTFVGLIAGVTPSGRTLLAHYNATSALIAVAPLRPSTPVLTAASDSGISQTDGITNVNTPTFTGTASDAGTVELYSDGTLVGTGTIGAGGAWSIQTSILADGTHVITAAVRDTIADLGPLAEGPSIRVDTVAPTIHATINAPAGTGWYNLATGPASVHYAAFDNSGGSGLASPVPPNHVFADGANQSLAGVTISDIAGNKATSESFGGINQDTLVPASTVAALPAQETGPFTLGWSGQDNAGGSGLAGYSVYVSDNGGPYVAFVLNTTSTSATFTGQAGHGYRFYSVASDVAGNLQPTPTSAQAATAVFAPTTTTLATQSPNPSNASQSLSFTATVSGGVPNGQTVLLEDTGNGNKVVASGTLSNGSATLTVPAGTLLAGTHPLIAVYGGDTTFAASQSAAYAQTVQVAVMSVVINGDNPNGLYTAAGQSAPGQQRSMVEDIVYTFSEAVTITNANLAFTVVAAGAHPGTAPTTLYAQAVAGSNGTQWAVSLTGQPEGTLASIANGEYRITINPAYVFAAVDGVTSMAPGTGRTDSFYRLYGDVFGTQNVTALDYSRFKASLTTYNPMFDNYNTGNITALDYAFFKKDLSVNYSSDGFVTTI